MISLAAWALYIVLFLTLYRKVLNGCKYNDNVMIFLIFAMPIISRMFLTPDNLGRTDIFMIIISIVACLLVVKDRLIFLVIPLCSVAMMIHQGYAFMFFNIVVAILLYRIVVAKDNKHSKKYYITILAIVSVVVIGLLLYFELFSSKFHAHDMETYNEIKEFAKQISNNDDYHEFVIKHEFLGAQESETWLSLKAALELVVYLVLISPIMWVAKSIAGTILKNTKNKAFTIVLMCGALSMLPDYVLKCDYGRWVFATFIYFFLLVVFLIIMGNQVVTNALQDVIAKIRTTWMGAFICVYFMMFLPMKDMVISKISARIVEVVWGIFT